MPGQDSTDELLRFDDKAIQDPHAFYELLRDESPVRQAVMPMGTRVWLVTRFAEARAALADPTLHKDARRLGELFVEHNVAGTPRPASSSSSEDAAFSAHMLNSDPPDHTRLRKLVLKAFTARRVEAMRGRIEQITDELIEQLGDGGTVDLLNSLAFPLPITVISELLGVPESDRDQFRIWSNILLSYVPDADAQAAGMAMAKFLFDLIAAKRAEPGEDMLSALVHARDEGDQLSEGELTAMAFLLMVAGHETTVNLIGNGVLALLRNPDQFAALRADRSLLPNAIEEFLRYDGPLNLATLRFTTEPIELGDVTIPAGEVVVVSLHGANRDPEHYSNPGELDLTRESGHLAFGHGIHFCLGAPLARMEAEVAFTKLLDRFDIELATSVEELTWRPSVLIHGLTELPVRLQPRTAATA